MQVGHWSAIRICCWASNKTLNSDFLIEFEAALRFGVENKVEAIADLAETNHEKLLAHVKTSISYDLGQSKAT